MRIRFFAIFFLLLTDFYEIFGVFLIGRDTSFLFKVFFSICNSFEDNFLTLTSKILKKKKKKIYEIFPEPSLD